MAEAFENIISANTKRVTESEDVKKALKDSLHDLENLVRELSKTFLDVDHARTELEILDICQRAHQIFFNVRKCYDVLKSQVVKGQYYKYRDLWRYPTQRIVFASAYIQYLETGELMLRKEVSDFIGVSSDASDGFHIDLDLYFIGILFLADELARLSAVYVIHGEYEKPVKIAEFLSALSVGFSLMNFKNDVLRRKYDALKYRLRSAQEIVTDLTIRGLIPSDPTEVV